MVELGNMIVMDSLDYFLGLINEDEEGSEGDEEEEDEEDMEEEEGNKKQKLWAITNVKLIELDRSHIQLILIYL